MEKHKFKFVCLNIGVAILLVLCCLKINTIYYKIRSTTKKVVKYIEYVKLGKSIENENNPVLGDETTGSLFDPWILTNEMGGYQMYISSRKTSSIVLSYSSDGIIWSKDFITCLESDNSTGWEDIINRACVIKMPDKYIMYYTGQSNNVSRIGYAESYDGKIFSRIQKDCILQPEFFYEGSSVMNPSVIWDETEGLFKMWYSAGEIYEPDVVCYATSKDGIHWEKYKYNPVFSRSGNFYDYSKVSVGQVIKNDNKYVMYYSGYQDIDTGYICRAYSNDGKTNWLRDVNNPLVMPRLIGWNSDSCYKPSVINKNDNNVFIYYNGRVNDKEYIGINIVEE